MNKGILAATIYFLVALFVIRACLWFYGLIRGARTPGVLQFWKIVAKELDYAYDFFCRSEIWETREHPLPPNFEEEFPSLQWAGPFDLYVPAIGKRISIFGKESDYRKSQEEFIKIFKNK